MKSLSTAALVHALVLLFVTAMPAHAYEITSPDGNVQVELGVKDGQLYYQVKLAGQPLLLPSPLGLVTSAGDFSQGLTEKSASEPTEVSDSYELRNDKSSHVDYAAQRGEYTVANAAGQQLTVIVQVSNDGVALTYRLGLGSDESVVVEKELTGFAFPTSAHGFLHPQHKARTGWARTFPSFEAHYSIDEPVGEPSTDGVGWCFPALFRVGEAGWVLLSETGVDGGYCGTVLGHDSTGGVYHLAFPQKLENLPEHPINPTVTGDAQLPWRILIVGKTLAPIVESTLATDVVKPKFEANVLPESGKSAWSWLHLKDGQTIEAVQREFIDMAADLEFQYVLIDSMWDQQIGREKIAELVEYAKGKNVGVLLWYNSNGPWNDAPQTPKECMYTAEARAKEMAWLRDTGVKGIKVDFFGGDKQAGMQFYEDLMTDANKYGLAINFHGTTIPRGWNRMFPCFVTNESVMGMEFCTFEQENADHQPQHCTVLPFTRNVIGPMDFTPTILDRRLGANNDGPQRRTSDAFELALPVLYQSGVQHFGLTPKQMAGQPELVKDYLRAIPTSWDETRFVDGYPGRFAVLARRSGEQWFVAAINGEDKLRELTLPLAFANASQWTLLSDGEGSAVQSAVRADQAGAVTLTLQPHGGAVLWSAAE